MDPRASSARTTRSAGLASTAHPTTLTIALLLDAFRRAAARNQTATLLARDPAAQVTLDNTDAIAFLLKLLRQEGAEEQISRLEDRLPVEGLFGFYIEGTNREVLYQFGRGIDGTPASSWGWNDLD